MDRVSQELLGRLALPNLRVVSIEEVEDFDPGLRLIRASRTYGEYCWTSVASACLYFFRAERQLELLSYLDADLHFSSSPQPLFDELAQGSILLSPHRTTPSLERVVGRYNGGWMTFRNDAAAHAALGWWRERCLEWCHGRIEPGLFGGQTYLDSFPHKFAGVREIVHPGTNVGPWNERRHALVKGAPDGPATVDGAPLIFFHHSGLQMFRAAHLARPFVWGGLMRERAQPLPLLFYVHWKLASAAGLELWTDYLNNVAAAVGELAATGIQPELWVDEFSFRWGVSKVSRRWLHSLKVDYRR